MIGLVYLNSNNKIISLIKNVQSYTPDSITGIDSSVKGVDLSQVSICTVSDSSTLQVGDILNDPVIILASAQQAKIAQINQAFSKALNTQFTSNATGTLRTYDYGTESQTAFSKLAIAMVANIQTYPVDITLADGMTYVSHSQVQCQQVLASISAFETPARSKKETLLKAVASATTVDAVNVITVQF